MSNPKITTVALIIAGTGPDLERVSKELNLQATEDRDKWQLKTHVTEDELETHLVWLGNRLKPHYADLRSLKSIADVYVYCGMSSDSDQCGLSLSPEALKVFTEVGMSMEVEIVLDTSDEF